MQMALIYVMKVPFFNWTKMGNFEKSHQTLRQVEKFRFLNNRIRTTVSRNHRNIFGLAKFCAKIFPIFAEILTFAVPPRSFKPGLYIFCKTKVSLTPAKMLYPDKR